MGSGYTERDIGTLICRAGELAGLPGEPDVEMNGDDRSWQWLLGIHEEGLFQRVFVSVFPASPGVTLMYGVKAMLPLPDGSASAPALRARVLRVSNTAELDETDLAFCLLDAKKWIENA